MRPGIHKGHPQTVLKESPLCPQIFRLICPQFLIEFLKLKTATNFCEISTLDWSYVVLVKSTVEILRNLVAFSDI